MVLRRPSGYSAATSGATTAASYGEWEKKAPFLAAFLCDLLWDDGTSREPGSLVLFTQDGVWKGCLSDREAGLSAFVSCPTPGALMDALEKGLREDRLDWRRKRQEKPAAPKKR
jgi:hypothetical protein